MGENSASFSGVSQPTSMQVGKDVNRMLFLCAITLAYVACSTYFVRSHDIADTPEVIRTSKIGLITLSLTLGIMLTSHTFGIIAEEKRVNIFHILYKDLKIYVFNRHSILNFSIPVVSLVVFLASFVWFKSYISEINPFSHDIYFHEMDRLLSLGIDPWVATHYIFGSNISTWIIDWAYNTWFAMKWFIFIYFVIKIDRPGLRLQYFSASIFCWAILGSVLALLLSSAGPVYFESLLGSSQEYGPLMDRLYQIDADLKAQFGSGLKALELQQTLWLNYSSGDRSIVSGISAMPSMHVSIATLMALGTWQLSRKLGVLMTIYAVTIMIGSVHLGWHYAVDGYVSIIGTIAIWYGTGWALRRMGLHDDAPATNRKANQSLAHCST